MTPRLHARSLLSTAHATALLVTLALAFVTSAAQPPRAAAAGSVGPATSPMRVLLASKVETTTTLTSSANPSVHGQSVTLTATVTPAAGTDIPTGNVDFKDGSTTIAGCASVALDAGGQATCTTVLFEPAAHSLTAEYGGDSAFDSSDGALTQVVNKANTTVGLTGDAPDPSIVGQPVSISYTVAANPPGSGTPTGDVTVSDGTDSCTGAVSAGSCSVTFTTAGLKLLLLSYGGDANFVSSASATEFHRVDRAATTIGITGDAPDPSVAGEPVAVSFAVSVLPPGAGTPTGNVVVSDGTSSCTGAVAAGGCALALASAGSTTLTATYAGDANFVGSTAPGEPHLVTKVDSVLFVASSANPSAFGELVTFTASIAPASSGPIAPGGTVQFAIDGSSFGAPVHVSGGSASIATSALTVAGSPHSVSAQYSGDAAFDPATGSLVGGQQVASAPTALALDLPTGVQHSDLVSLRASVTPSSAGGQVPTGSVQFFIAGAPVGAAPVDAAGVAALSGIANPRAAGTYDVTAAFTSASEHFAGSSGGPLPLTVTRENARIQYTGDLITPVGSPLALRATVLDSAAAGFIGVNRETAPNATIGDITRVWIEFAVYPAGSCGTGTPVALQYAQVADVAPAGDGIGTASVRFTAPGQTSLCVAIRLVADAGGGANLFYTAPNPRSASLESYAITGQHVDGDGRIVLPNGRRASFKLQGRHDALGRPEGAVEYTFRGRFAGGPADFSIRSTAVNAVMFTGGAFPIKVVVQGRATIRVTRPSTGAVLLSDGNATFLATARDGGAGGPDAFGLAVYDGSGRVFRNVPTTRLEVGAVIVR